MAYAMLAIQPSVPIDYERERLADPLKRDFAFGSFSYQLQIENSPMILRIHFANQDAEDG